MCDFFAKQCCHGGCCLCHSHRVFPVGFPNSDRAAIRESESVVHAVDKL